MFCSLAEATAVKLKSKQEEIFEVEKEVACRSVTVKNMVEDTGLDTPVPLPMVDSKILIKVRAFAYECPWSCGLAWSRPRPPYPSRNGMWRAVPRPLAHQPVHQPSHHTASPWPHEWPSLPEWRQHLVRNPITHSPTLLPR